MTNRYSKRGTGNPEIDAEILALLDKLGAEHNRDQLFEIFATAAQLATEDVQRLDLKITNTALGEMRNVFNTFRPYDTFPKVTIFGSARTLPTDPLYAQARDTARSTCSPRAAG